MSTKHLIKEARKRLKKKAKYLDSAVVKKIEEDISNLEKCRAAKSKKKLDAARRKVLEDAKKYMPKKALEIVKEYAVSLVMAVLIAVTIRHFIIEPYKIPSGSMIPTFEFEPVKDKILLNKFTYGPKIPFTSKRLWNKRPQRWDIVVFTTRELEKASDFPKNFVKRVVGLSGEEIEIKDGQIYVNGQLETKPEWMQQLGIHYGNVSPTQPAGYIKVEYHINLFGLHLFAKKNPPPRYVPKGFWEYGFKGQKFTVPSDHYFVLGDNSKHSYDSRGWGFVPYENIKGKVVLIWWPPGRVSVIK